MQNGNENHGLRQTNEHIYKRCVMMLEDKIKERTKRMEQLKEDNHRMRNEMQGLLADIYEAHDELVNLGCVNEDLMKRLKAAEGGE